MARNLKPIPEYNISKIWKMVSFIFLFYPKVGGKQRGETQSKQGLHGKGPEWGGSQEGQIGFNFNFGSGNFSGVQEQSQGSHGGGQG